MCQQALMSYFIRVKVSSDQYITLFDTWKQQEILEKTWFCQLSLFVDKLFIKKK